MGLGKSLGKRFKKITKSSLKAIGINPNRGGGGGRGTLSAPGKFDQAAYDEQFAQQQAAARPGVRLSKQTEQERKAGVSPAAFEGMRDINTGALLKDYTFDPYAGEATQALKGEAFGTSQDSPWLKLQRARELQGMDQASKAGLQSMSQAQSQLAMTGGLSSGARERMARGGAKDLMLAKQGINREGTQARLGRQGELLGSFADVERQGQLQNISTRQQDLQNAAMFDSNRYNQQMQAWAARESGKAQVAAAQAQPRPKSGCCFIFLEARYGNGVMDKVVRRYRDENMTPKNKRGYYKLAEVLVPLMRKHKLAKFLVRALMTDPLVAYGKWHYGLNSWGWIFAPVKSFWLGTFDLLGGETEFIRETGEVV